MNSRSTIYRQYELNKQNNKKNLNNSNQKSQLEIDKKQSLGLDVISRDGLYLNRNIK